MNNFKKSYLFHEWNSLGIDSSLLSAKFSFDILGINAENLKVNKCSHKNKSEQMSI